MVLYLLPMWFAVGFYLQNINVSNFLYEIGVYPYLKEAKALVSNGFRKPKPSCVNGLGMEATTDGGGAPPPAPKYGL